MKTLGISGLAKYAIVMNFLASVKLLHLKQNTGHFREIIKINSSLIGYECRKKWAAGVKDVVVLLQLTRSPVRPSPSSFPLNFETYLRMAAIPHEVDCYEPFGPKRKTPWITLNDQEIGDSQLMLVYCPMSKLQSELYRATVDKTIATLLGASAKAEEPEVQPNGRPKRRAAKRNINYSAMGNDEVTEELKKKSMKKEDEEIDEWIKLSNDLHRELPQAKKRGTKTVDVKMQNPMMQLRKIVNHPSLVKWEVDAETGDYVVDESMVSDSGKLSVLDQMLKRLIKDGHKVLIFSQLTIMLDVLADYLAMRGWKFGRLDGRMSLEDRAEDMDRFRNDPDTPVFLISTRAGGLGVNLTAADTVIIYDSDWNPQCDLQAQDRCHRLGQTRPVVVYRFVTADTIDQRIIDRAGAKRKLEKLVIQKGKFKSGLQADSSTGLSSNELLELLKTRDHNGEYRGGAGLVFTELELAALLDRSDLVKGSQQKRSEELNQMKGVFKRLDAHAADDVKSK